MMMMITHDDCASLTCVPCSDVVVTVLNGFMQKSCIILLKIVCSPRHLTILQRRNLVCIVQQRVCVPKDTCAALVRLYWQSWLKFSSGARENVQFSNASVSSDFCAIAKQIRIY